ncbi:hypothetical protein ACFW6S_31490 [Streptomyces sp. NPDC058740]|uniref:hypothetical protein n=1 Tax=Streptomyces sp. NPDC058740 TaxID=3346619 RepID=UPI00369F2C16
MDEINYPLIFTDDEGVAHSVPSKESLELIAEFVDDWDPEYDCRDSSGNRVRLIVWGLEALLVQAVPDSFNVSDLEIQKFTDGNVEVLVEFYSGEPLRAVRERLEATCEGLQYAPTGAPSVTPREFNKIWMRARLGARYKA